MHTFCETLTQALAIPAIALPPANRANNATVYTVGPVTAKQFRRFMGIVNVGVLTGASNVSAYLQGCNTSNGTYANISSSNAVAFSNTSNTVMTVECRSDQLNAGNQFVQLAILVAANSAFVGGELLGADPAYSPANAYDLNSTYVAARTVY